MSISGQDLDTWGNDEELHTPVISSMRRPLDFAYSVCSYCIDITDKGISIVHLWNEVNCARKIPASLSAHAGYPHDTTDKPWRSGPVNVGSFDSSDTHLVADLLYQVG